MSSSTDYPIQLNCQANICFQDLCIRVKPLKDPNEIEAKDTNGYTPLMRAVLEGNLDEVKAPVYKGANIETKDDQQGKTALEWAIHGKHQIVVDVLTDRK